MQALSLTPEARKAIEQDALRTFPNECCGFIYGNDGETREVTLALPVENQKDGDQRRRFEITPAQYMHAEREALKRGLTLLGVYHSHPKHPAQPSEHDRVQAMPWFSYIIINAEAHGTGDLNSFVLNDERQFEEQPVLTQTPTQL
jgi:proteasome lid subunit RPN8/RPN11